VHILAENGGDVIYTAELAVKFKLTVQDLTDTFGPYLTMAKGLRLAAQPSPGTSAASPAAPAEGGQRLPARGPVGYDIVYDDEDMTIDRGDTMTQARVTRPDLKSELTARFFQVLSDPTRVRIVELLLEGEKNVSELVEALGMQQGRVSSHLACLKWCGFIGTRREGKFVYYRVTDERVRELMRLAQQMLADNAGEVASCLRLSGEHAL
jgi:ArsR family transcriptional regulator